MLSFHRASSGIGLLVLASIATLASRAQEIRILDRQLQIHGFASQGYVWSGNNNWLTMMTADEGSAAFTDFGGNASVQITDKVRIGAQLYDRRIGQLGRWHPSLDWAVASYRFKDWFGLRGGKVKTTLGLYNDTQDLDFLHPFALLPQSVYQTDLRDSTISHEGGDAFGDIRLPRRFGTVSYTAYAGHREDSHYGGYPYLISKLAPGTGIDLHSYGGLQYGADLRWQTPLRGVLVGISRMNEEISGHGIATTPGIPPFPVEEHSNHDWIDQYYVSYERNKFQFDAEWRRYWRDEEILNGGFDLKTDVRGWYGSLAYRVLPRFQLGGYYSQYFLFSNNTAVPNPDDQHIYDRVISGRVDLNRYFNVKVEGHFMTGVGVPALYPSGFYTAQNPNGFQPATNALVAKTSFNF